MFLADKSVVLTFSVLILFATNANYTVYHVYMGQNKEYSTRLLNKLYLHMGVWAQIGSVINFVLILKGLEIVDFEYIGILRHLQLPMIIFSFLKISIAHNIKRHYSDFYLDLGYKISNWHLLLSMILLRYNIFKIVLF